MHLTYDIRATWEENCLRGPQFADPCPEVPATPEQSFLGMPVRSRIGIAAGLLPNSRWLLPYAARGFDLLTYKTVRSVARPCYPLPNWVFVKDLDPPDGPVLAMEQPSDDPTQVSSSVCFGMPSTDPNEWRADIQRCRRGLLSEQLLIVSIVATPPENATLTDIANDFARCAAWAVESGAHVIEANLSCPNVCSAEGTLYQDVDATRVVGQSIRAAIGEIPLLLKIGTFHLPAQQRRFLQVAADFANGIATVNCIRRPVLNRDGEPVFGPHLRNAGVLGRAIHEASVESVATAKQIIEADRLPLEIAAVGGASTVADFADFFNVGADAVLCGSSPMYLPNLAIEIKRSRPDW